LQEIIQENNAAEWTEEAFEAIKRILLISKTTQSTPCHGPIFPVSDTDRDVDIYMLPITTLSNADELICFFEGDYFYYRQVICGTKLKKQELNRIITSDYSHLKRITMKACEVSLSKNVFAFNVQGFHESFLLNGKEAITKVETILKNLSQYKNTQTGTRKANIEERFKEALPFWGITGLFAFFSILIPWMFSVEESAPTVHIFMIPFLKIGYKWTIGILFSITALCFIFSILEFVISASNKSQFVKFGE
jgi:hypothetical protein